MDLVGIIGDWGTGKTLLMTRLALLSLSKERKVYANYHLNLVNYEYVEPLELYQNKTLYGDVYLDEIYTWLESRVSSSFINRYVSYIILQSRKRYCDIYGTLQLLSTADLRFRDKVTVYIKTTRVDNGNPDKDKWDFKYEFLRVVKNKRWAYILPYEKAKRYFDYYDTAEIIEPYDKDRVEHEILKRAYPRKYNMKAREIALYLRKRFESDFLDNITHIQLKILLGNLEILEGYEERVYQYLKVPELSEYGLYDSI